VEIAARLVAHARGSAGTLLTLSPCGAFFACDRELAPGTPALLSFSTDVGQFEGGCEVLYVAEVADRRGVALRFFEQPVENQEIVVKALAACAAD
jgi:hypothetical protein